MSQVFAEKSKPLLSVSGNVSREGSQLVVENAEARIVFDGDSAKLMSTLLPRLDGCRTLADLSAETGHDVATMGAHLAQLEQDSLIVDWAAHEVVGDIEGYVRAVRSFSRFYNQQIFSNSPAKKIFSGQSTSPAVIGWGLEFYFFVRAANEYMPRAIQALTGDIRIIEPIVQHYVEEALHEAIFAKGLATCGFDKPTLARRLPLASTLALTNHLFETACRGVAPYCALFAVMQPGQAPASKEQIAARYDQLRSYYPAAAGIFEAFEEHDGIDAGLEHSELLLEKVARVRGMPSPAEILDTMVVIQRTAFFFMLFYKGIDSYYRDEACLRRMRRANAGAVI
jgi:hypothetical protein